MITLTVVKNWIKNQLLSITRKITLRVEGRYDARFLDPEVPMAKIISHQNWQDYLSREGNCKGLRILEIGSREVTGKSDARSRFANAQYTGFDYHPGENVDVVGDAHKLSSYFSEGEQFDIIYSSACFEHFAMPWVVATEIAKMVKLGGLVFVETHFSYSSHERPWHFFQFSDLALQVLFSKECQLASKTVHLLAPKTVQSSQLI